MLTHSPRNRALHEAPVAARLTVLYDILPEGGLYWPGTPAREASLEWRDQTTVIEGVYTMSTSIGGIAGKGRSKQPLFQGTLLQLRK